MSSDLKELITLMNDTLNGKVGLFNEGAAKYTDQAIREAFFNILGDDKLTWANYRENKYKIFTIMENVLTTNLPQAWESSAFYNQFVETRNGALGDTNEFLVDSDGILYASRISGNHWDIERQKIYGKRAFTVPTSWIGISLYNDFERFLKGITTLQEMVQKAQKAIQNEIDTMIYSQFSGIATYLPGKFVETGSYDRQTLVDLIQRVQIASQKNVIIAGTKGALSHIADNIDGTRLSERQKEELATKGALIDYTGLGVIGCEIPSSFIRGTYDFMLDTSTIYVLPDNERFIKLFFEGDSRVKEATSPEDNMDMTLALNYQVKVGCATIISNLCGKYTIEG